MNVYKLELANRPLLEYKYVSADWPLNLTIKSYLNKMVDDLQGEQFVVSGLNSTAEEQAKIGIQS